MEFMHWRKVAISLQLFALLFALNFTNLEGLSTAPERRLVELDYASGAKQSDDTVRIDPLDNFKKYRGGFDITNKHYWSSTIFTGIYGYVIAVLWLLCGLGYGLFLLASTCCSKRKNREFKKKSTCYKRCYLWLTLSAIVLTILAITATGMVLGGNAKLRSRTDTVADIIVDTADGASETIYTTTRALRDMNTDLAHTDVRHEAAHFLIPTSRSLDRTAADIHRETTKNRRLAVKGLKILYIVTTVIISLNLVGVISLTVFGILKFRRTFHLLIAVCWIFTILCWLFFGIYFLLDNFAGDACTALESFEINPYNNSLSSILPCDELLAAQSILYEVSEGIHRVVNRVNQELSINYGNVAQICNPFAGPPDYNYEPDQNCPSSAIRIGDLPRIIKRLTCTDRNCTGGVLISRRDFNNIEAYTTALKRILDVYPGMESLAECNTVSDSFSDILENHCKPLKKDAHMTWGGLIFLSVVMVALVLLWSFEAHHEQNHHPNFDSSIKPHSSAAVDMIELGRVKEVKSDAINPSSVRGGVDSIKNKWTKMESEAASPGFGASLQLKDCIEELLRFTLVSSIDGTLEIDLRLSKDYCSTLLQEDPSHPFPDSTGLSEGVPLYPLYKNLAASLYEVISSEALPRTESKLAVMQETSSLKQKEEEWASLIREKGSHLLNVLKSVDFELHVQEPYFSLLRNGQKTVEGRCAVGNYNKIEPGAFILINKCLVLQVQDVNHYHSFREMLELENLKEVLPGVDTAEEGVQVYRKFYSEEKERSNGVLAISVKKLVSQPFIDLGSMLAELSYAGVQRLLGFTCTVGTVSEALPPPASSLISSFLLPHNPNAKGCTLTDGARALSKHVNRSSDRYWGSFSGSDSEKNRVALDVISDLITRCCWMNVHIVPPHGVVFELRVANGYGARWSKDGSKFIGFLEPYMEDGHSKGWRH